MNERKSCRGRKHVTKIVLDKVPAKVSSVNRLPKRKLSLQKQKFSPKIGYGFVDFNLCDIRQSIQGRNYFGFFCIQMKKKIITSRGETIGDLLCVLVAQETISRLIKKSLLMEIPFSYTNSNCIDSSQRQVYQPLERVEFGC